MSPMFFIIIYLVTFIFESSANFPCITVQSSVSGTGDDDRVSISCPSSHPTMTSCGFWGENINGIRRDGGYIAGSKCYAQNGSKGGGVRAMARCCQFPASMTCIDKSAKVSGDDNRVHIGCPSGYHLFGCTAYCPWSDFDGSYFNQYGETLPGSNFIMTPDEMWANRNYNEGVCSVQSSGAETTGQARCCKSSQYKISCKTRYGTGGGRSSIAGCPDGYTMTGCSAWTWWNNQIRWYIHENLCGAVSVEGGKVWSSAQCCRVDTTSSAMSIGFSRSDDSKSIVTTLIVLVLTILVIISLLYCIYYQIKTICFSTSKSYEKVVVSTTEIDESTDDEMQKLKGYQI